MQSPRQLMMDYCHGSLKKLQLISLGPFQCRNSLHFWILSVQPKSIDIQVGFLSKNIPNEFLTILCTFQQIAACPHCSSTMFYSTALLETFHLVSLDYVRSSVLQTPFGCGVYGAVIRILFCLLFNILGSFDCCNLSHYQLEPCQVFFPDF